MFPRKLRWDLDLNADLVEAGDIAQKFGQSGPEQEDEGTGPMQSCS